MLKIISEYFNIPYPEFGSPQSSWRDFKRLHRAVNERMFADMKLTYTGEWVITFGCRSGRLSITPVQSDDPREDYLKLLYDRITT